MDFDINYKEDSDISDGEFEEEDFEEDPFDNEEDDEDNDLDEDNNKKELEKNIEDDNDLDDEIELETEEGDVVPDEEEVQIPEKKRKGSYYEKLEKYKKMNIEDGSEYCIISLMANLSIFIKNGGSMLDGRVNFDYPNETEESYIIESILLNTHPMSYVVNDKEVILNHESVIINLKKVLSCVLKFEKIFLTPDFRKNFPIFIENIFNNSVSDEEYKEIEKVKKMRNING